MARRISQNRKTAFYAGSIISGCGFLLFLTVIFMPNSITKDMSFEDREFWNTLCAFGGGALFLFGQFIRVIGARGLAGSGVILNPEQARADLEPYSRMAGGMVKDALDEAELSPRQRRAARRRSRRGVQSDRANEASSDDGGQAEVVIRLRCPSCGTLNEEDSKYCQECGRKL